MKTLNQILIKINNKCKNKNIKSFVFGKGLADILVNKTPEKINILVKANKNDKIIEELEILNDKLIKISFDKKIPEHNITYHNLFIEIEDLLKGNIKEIKPVNSFKDLKRKIIKLSKEGKENIKKDFNVIFEVLQEACDENLTIEINTVKEILKNKSLVKKTPKRFIYNYIRFICSQEKPKKIVSYLNTFGISEELFNTQLVESPFCNHLKPNDYFEFMFLIFNNVELNNIEEFLINKVGFHLRDTHFVVNLYNAISEIEDESELSARKFINKLGTTQRISNVIRLVKLLGFKELGKNIKSQKDLNIFKDEICLDESTIKAAFGIKNENTIKNLISIAKQKIIDDPEYNEKYKILTYLNKERGILWQEEKKEVSS